MHLFSNEKKHFEKVAAVKEKLQMMGNRLPQEIYKKGIKLIKKEATMKQISTLLVVVHTFLQNDPI